MYHPSCLFLKFFLYYYIIAYFITQDIQESGVFFGITWRFVNRRIYILNVTYHVVSFSVVVFKYKINYE